MAGIRTLDDVRDRCRIDDITGCWIWGGAVAEGSPVTYLPAAGRKVSVMRAVAYLRTGAFPACAWRTCSTPLCCRCVAFGTVAEHGAWIAATGQRRGLLSYSLGGRKPRRNHLPPHVRREILASTETGEAVALRLGVSHSAVCRLRRGETHQSIGDMATMLRRAA